MEQQLLDSFDKLLTIGKITFYLFTDFFKEVYYAEMGMPLWLYL